MFRTWRRRRQLVVRRTDPGVSMEDGPRPARALCTRAWAPVRRRRRRAGALASHTPLGVALREEVETHPKPYQVEMSGFSLPPPPVPAAAAVRRPLDTGSSGGGGGSSSSSGAAGGDDGGARRKRSRWGDEEEKVNAPGVVLPSNLSTDEQENYLRTRAHARTAVCVHGGKAQAANRGPARTCAHSHTRELSATQD
jgi:hypothetical protein